MRFIDLNAFKSKRNIIYGILIGPYHCLIYIMIYILLCSTEIMPGLVAVAACILALLAILLYISAPIGDVIAIFAISILSFIISFFSISGKPFQKFMDIIGASCTETNLAAAENVCIVVMYALFLTNVAILIFKAVKASRH